MAQLGRFSYPVQDTSGNAVAGASVAVYREGATVNGNQSGASPTTFNVRHRGKIVTGDNVFVNAATGTLYAATVVSATQITLGGYVGTLSLTNGDRLTPAGSQPTLYSDDQGGATTSNPLTSSSAGRVQCWMEYGAYDLVLSGGGLTATPFTSEVMPTEAIGQTRYADEFAIGSSTGGIQEAINDLPSAGGVVMLSGGRTYSPSVATTMVSNLTIEGNGATIQRSSGINALSIFNDSGSALSRVAIRGIIFDNNSLAATAKDILLTGGASDITLERNTWINLTNRTSDLATIQSSASKGARIAVRNNTVVGGTTTNTYNSFQVLDCDNVDISGNVIDGWGAIKVEGSQAASLFNWSVRGNRMKNLDQSNIFCRIQSASSVRGVNISDNIMVDCGKLGIVYTAINAGDTGTMKDAVISGNTINGFGLTIEDDAIQVGGIVTSGTAYCTNVSVVGNVINGLKSDGTFQTPGRGLSIEAGTQYVSVYANTISNCGRSGIGIGASDAVVSGNTISRCVRTDTSASPPTPSQESGIATFGNAIYQCNNVLIVGNLSKNNGVSGAVMSYGIALVANNTGTNSNHYAFNNRCYDDQGTKTQDYGITIGFSGGTGPSNSKIAFNDLSGNQTGHVLIQGTNTGLTYMPPPANGTNISSAATISIPQDGDIFHVTGAVNITNGITVNTGDAGRIVTLVFDSTPTISDTGTSVLAGNFVASADDSLTIRCDGTNWYEVARSVN